jgi:hypothetical protein
MKKRSWQRYSWVLTSKAVSNLFLTHLNPFFAVRQVVQLGKRFLTANSDTFSNKILLWTQISKSRIIFIYNSTFLSNFQHVVIVNNEIHSSSCVLHYYECSRNHALSASQLELFFHLVQVKNKSFIGLVLPQTFTAGYP